MKFEKDILNMQKLSDSKLRLVIGGANSEESPAEDSEEHTEQLPVNPLPNINISPAAAISIVVFTVASWVYTTYRIARGGTWCVKWFINKFEPN